MKICTIIGARPQIIKHTALEIALQAYDNIDHIVIHTGQHYDDNMNQIFFDDFRLTKPDYQLRIGSHSHAVQTAMMMKEIEIILQDTLPDYLILYGDTNSTLAGALVASKLHIKIAHIEAGLRSFNMQMPEEINRVITDRISNILFAPSSIAMEHLLDEGLSDKAYLSGDIMKDLISHYLIYAKETQRASYPYYYATIHRPYNTDIPARLIDIFISLNSLSHKVIFSLHPRTKALTQSQNIDLSQYQNITFIPPVGYFDNLNYVSEAHALITDSGGMQKEAYWLKTKCITIRSETEWTETLQNGCNHLVFDKLNELKSYTELDCGLFDESLYGDGKSAHYIISKMLEDTELND